jgi:hypothetical protein
VEPLLEADLLARTDRVLFYRYGWQLSIDEPAFARIREALAIKTALQKFLEAVGSSRVVSTRTRDESDRRGDARPGGFCGRISSGARRVSICRRSTACPLR